MNILLILASSLTFLACSLSSAEAVNQSNCLASIVGTYHAEELGQITRVGIKVIDGQTIFTMANWQAVEWMNDKLPSWSQWQSRRMDGNWHQDETGTGYKIVCDRNRLVVFETGIKPYQILFSTKGMISNERSVRYQQKNADLFDRVNVSRADKVSVYLTGQPWQYPFDLYTEWLRVGPDVIK